MNYKTDLSKNFSNVSDYIEIKFGDMRKGYNFTRAFCQKYPVFCQEFDKYFYHKESFFQNPVQILMYVEKYEIPVDFYYNIIDEFAKDIDSVWDYFQQQLNPEPLDKSEDYRLEKQLKQIQEEGVTEVGYQTTILQDDYFDIHYVLTEMIPELITGGLLSQDTKSQYVLPIILDEYLSDLEVEDFKPLAKYFLNYGL